MRPTEEAMVNDLLDNHSTTGRDNHYVEALPRDRLRRLVKKYHPQE